MAAEAPGETPVCLPCIRWARYTRAMDESDTLAGLGHLQCEPCPEHDGWTLADVAHELFARAGGAHPMSVGALLRAKDK